MKELLKDKRISRISSNISSNIIDIVKKALSDLTDNAFIFYVFL